MGCFTFIKVMMILFNLAIFLSGGTLLGVGIWVAVDDQSFVDIFGGLSSTVVQVVYVGYFLIVIGAILLVIGFLGCYGAQKDSKCLLMMAETLLSAVVTPLLKEKYGTDNSFTHVWNATMKEIKCCGLNNYTDFTNSTWYEHHKVYPDACCDFKQPCDDMLAAKTNVTGCFHQILTEIKTNAGVVGGVAAGIAALEVAAMVVSMYLYCHLDQK
ncbi:tetraspanin-1 isoform X2 [Chroicocephalus ridibundus]|uniref:tetraspanin-1 isoform X2 n=1 Tax=Chroicocephalus ridibundus TaxID=1192867 RepID=UPI002FDD4CE5